MTAPRFLLRSPSALVVLSLAAAPVAAAAPAPKPRVPPDPAPVTATYNAFDLAAGTLPLRNPALSPDTPPITFGLVPSTDASSCTLKAGHLAKAANSQCTFFSTPTPGSLWIVAKIEKEDSTTAEVKFDDGLDSGLKPAYDGSQIDLTPLVARYALDFPLQLAYFDNGSSTWKTLEASKPVIATSTLPHTGALYVRSGHSTILKVTYKKAPKPDLGWFTCGNEPPRFQRAIYRDLNYYVVCIDQATSDEVPKITWNMNNIVPPNYYGMIIVRHWADVVPVTIYSGSTIALVTPSFDGTATTAQATSRGQGHSIVQAPSGDPGFEVSAFLIPPHVPGYFHIDVTFVPVATTGNTTSSSPQGSSATTSGSTTPKPADPTSQNTPDIKTIGVDVITDTAYSGALRLGISRLFGASDHRYLASQSAASGTAQISEFSGAPVEVVIGYSLYLNALGTGSGRTYHVNYGYSSWYGGLGNYLARHMGLFAGVGILGYAGTQLDYLRTLYLGLEIDLSSNVSIAGTFAFHRDERLVDASPGGPVPVSGIQTQGAYETGFGLIFNATTEFFQFVEHNPGIFK